MPIHPPPESVPAEDHQMLIKEIDPCSTGLKYHQEKLIEISGCDHSGGNGVTRYPCSKQTTDYRFVS